MGTEVNLGLKHGVNRLVDYDSQWPSAFAEEQARLKKALGPRKIHRPLRLDFRAGAALETHYRHYDRRAAAGGLGEMPRGARSAGLRLR